MIKTDPAKSRPTGSFFISEFQLLPSQFHRLSPPPVWPPAFSTAFTPKANSYHFKYHELYPYGEV
jgi:hypothetical protein